MRHYKYFGTCNNGFKCLDSIQGTLFASFRDSFMASEKVAASALREPAILPRSFPIPVVTTNPHIGTRTSATDVSVSTSLGLSDVCREQHLESRTRVVQGDRMCWEQYRQILFLRRSTHTNLRGSWDQRSRPARRNKPHVRVYPLTRPARGHPRATTGRGHHTASTKNGKKPQGRR